MTFLQNAIKLYYCDICKDNKACTITTDGVDGLFNCNTCFNNTGMFPIDRLEKSTLVCKEIK